MKGKKAVESTTSVKTLSTSKKGSPSTIKKNSPSITKPKGPRPNSLRHRPHLSLLKTIKACRKFLKKFRQKRQISLENFDEVWFQLKFINVIIHKSSYLSQHAHISQLMQVVKTFCLPPNTISTRMRAFYLLHAIYFAQKNFCIPIKIKVQIQELRHFRLFADRMKKKEHKELIDMMSDILQADCLEFVAFQEDFSSGHELRRYKECPIWQQINHKTPKDLFPRPLRKFKNCSVLQKVIDNETTYMDCKKKILQKVNTEVGAENPAISEQLVKYFYMGYYKRMPLKSEMMQSTPDTQPSDQIQPTNVVETPINLDSIQTSSSNDLSTTALASKPLVITKNAKNNELLLQSGTVQITPDTQPSEQIQPTNAVEKVMNTDLTQTSNPNGLPTAPASKSLVIKSKKKQDKGIPRPRGRPKKIKRGRPPKIAGKVVESSEPIIVESSEPVIVKTSEAVIVETEECDNRQTGENLICEPIVDKHEHAVLDELKCLLAEVSKIQHTNPEVISFSDLSFQCLDNHSSNSIVKNETSTIVGNGENAEIYILDELCSLMPDENPSEIHKSRKISMKRLSPNETNCETPTSTEKQQARPAKIRKLETCSTRSPNLNKTINMKNINIKAKTSEIKLIKLGQFKASDLARIKSHVPAKLATSKGCKKLDTTQPSTSKVNKQAEIEIQVESPVIPEKTSPDVLIVEDSMSNLVKLATSKGCKKLDTTQPSTSKVNKQAEIEIQVESTVIPEKTSPDVLIVEDSMSNLVKSTCELGKRIIKKPKRFENEQSVPTVKKKKPKPEPRVQKVVPQPQTTVPRKAVYADVTFFLNQMFLQNCSKKKRNKRKMNERKWYRYHHLPDLLKCDDYSEETENEIRIICKEVAERDKIINVGCLKECIKQMNIEKRLAKKKETVPGIPTHYLLKYGQNGFPAVATPMFHPLNPKPELEQILNDHTLLLQRQANLSLDTSLQVEIVMEKNVLEKTLPLFPMHSYGSGSYQYIPLGSVGLTFTQEGPKLQNLHQFKCLVKDPCVVKNASLFQIEKSPSLQVVHHMIIVGYDNNPGSLIATASPETVKTASLLYFRTLVVNSNSKQPTLEIKTINLGDSSVTISSSTQNFPSWFLAIEGADKLTKNIPAAGYTMSCDPEVYNWIADQTELNKNMLNNNTVPITRPTSPVVPPPPGCIQVKHPDGKTIYIPMPTNEETTQPNKVCKKASAKTKDVHENTREFWNQNDSCELLARHSGGTPVIPQPHFTPLSTPLFSSQQSFGGIPKKTATALQQITSMPQERCQISLVSDKLNEQQTPAEKGLKTRAKNRVKKQQFIRDAVLKGLSGEGWPWNKSASALDDLNWSDYRRTYSRKNSNLTPYEWVKQRKQVARGIVPDRSELYNPMLRKYIASLKKSSENTSVDDSDLAESSAEIAASDNSVSCNMPEL